MIAAKPLRQVLEAASAQNRNHRDAEVIGEAPLLGDILAAQRVRTHDKHQSRARLDRAPDLLIERRAAAGQRVTVKPDPHARSHQARDQRVGKFGVVSSGIGQERIETRTGSRHRDMFYQDCLILNRGRHSETEEPAFVRARLNTSRRGGGSSLSIGHTLYSSHANLAAQLA